ncbi:hypothetical protein NF865_02045 [Thermococcus aggregans]|uniref:Uncharacterized protein n=1 Tax=Thermococcus aggregans TaxID=110163 RepID=A0A9E7MY34_THEAG|nr:hypothetical protein [Thermococcus aggregans]USS41023.1 hypothetical protein NF865_02045 [Thermococcus aggregans]
MYITADVLEELLERAKFSLILLTSGAEVLELFVVFKEGKPRGLLGFGKSAEKEELKLLSKRLEVPAWIVQRRKGKYVMTNIDTGEKIVLEENEVDAFIDLVFLGFCFYFSCYAYRSLLAFGG